MDYTLVAAMIALGFLVLDPGLASGNAKAGLVLITTVCLAGGLATDYWTSR